MGQPEDRSITYIELPCADTNRVKAFYGNVFGWEFKDWAPGYTSFFDGHMAGGFTTDAKVASGGPLVVMYAKDLEGMQAKIQAAGGKITVQIFSYPGGRRFHFSDPEGNVLAVCSDPK
jgi:predicted enzyme related to lactoylglutathione lyase